MKRNLKMRNQWRQNDQKDSSINDQSITLVNFSTFRVMVSNQVYHERLLGLHLWFRKRLSNVIMIAETKKFIGHGFFYFGCGSSKLFGLHIIHHFDQEKSTGANHLFLSHCSLKFSHFHLAFQFARLQHHTSILQSNLPTRN